MLEYWLCEPNMVWDVVVVVVFIGINTGQNFK
jgi:hypothetical protein